MSLPDGAVLTGYEGYIAPSSGDRGAWEALWSALDLGVILTGEDGRVERVNPGFRRLSGLGSGRVEGRRAWEVLEALAPGAGAADGREARGRRPDGRPLTLSCHSLEWEGGGGRRIILVEDRTRRTALEEDRREQAHRLGERIKELNCLYRLARLFEEKEEELPALLERTLSIITGGWQHPDVACARLTLDGDVWLSPGFAESPWKQEAAVELAQGSPARLEVFYREARPPADEGPFLKEERDLLSSIAGRLGALIDHRRALLALEERERELSARARELADLNTALKAILELRDRERAQIREDLRSGLERLAGPCLTRLRATGLTREQEAWLTVLEDGLQEAAAPLTSRLAEAGRRLTSTELDVAELLRGGRRSKEIAGLLGLSPATVACHRRSIRRKLGLTNRKANLGAFLRSLGSSGEPGGVPGK